MAKNPDAPLSDSSRQPHRTSLLASELADEQAHVDRVYANLAHAMDSAREAHRQGQQIYQTDRSGFVREEDSTAMFERDAFSYQTAKRLAILDAEHEGLVFGRLDLNTPETRYIGRIGVRDQDYEPLVIDWRAPAAEPFYRATSQNPMDVVRRRVLRCRDDKVIGIEDDLIDANADTDLAVIGEGALMAALTRARGHTMRDIVATIQAEQDSAIRAPYQGVTTISGGPGTGKTVVALHRAAYLLYTNRKRLEKGGVLVIGPSPIFMNYIERVLPSLGEDTVTLRSIGQVASDVLGYSSQRLDPAEAATVKGSLRMRKLLRRLAYEPLSASDTAELRVTAKGEVLKLSAAEIAEIRTTVFNSQKLNLARPLAEKLTLDALWQKMPEVEDFTRAAFDQMVTGSPRYIMFMNACWPSLSPESVLARLADRELAHQVGEGLFTPTQIDVLSESYRMMDHTVAGSLTGWTVADTALLDELAYILGPQEDHHDDDDPVMFLETATGVTELVTTADKLTFTREIGVEAEVQDTYAHILVDEAQDITPMQWRMLRRRGPQASWTLVGDPAQSSFPIVTETNQALTSLIGRSPHRNFTLTTNYRSPAEVFDLAARVIQAVDPEANVPDAVRKTGVTPTLLSCPKNLLISTIEDTIASLVEEVAGTIGVICPPSLMDEIQERVDNGQAAAAAGDRLVLVTPLESKGLEYDGVIVVSPDDIVAESPGGVRVLYVALTRPTQRLVTIDIDRGERSNQWRKYLPGD